MDGKTDPPDRIPLSFPNSFPFLGLLLFLGCFLVHARARVGVAGVVGVVLFGVSIYFLLFEPWPGGVQRRTGTVDDVVPWTVLTGR